MQPKTESRLFEISGRPTGNFRFCGQVVEGVLRWKQHQRHGQDGPDEIRKTKRNADGVH